MTVIDQIFYKVAEIAIPHFFITVEFSASGTEMPEHIEAFLQKIRSNSSWSQWT